MKELSVENEQASVLKHKESVDVIIQESMQEDEEFEDEVDRKSSKPESSEKYSKEESVRSSKDKSDNYKAGQSVEVKSKDVDGNNDKEERNVESSFTYNTKFSDDKSSVNVSIDASKKQN